MDTLISQTHNLTVSNNPPMGLTENLSPTYLSTGNPCLDFFCHVVPNTPSSQLTQRLSLAWTHDPLMTLKLVFNLRGVRGTGKSDKEGFYAAALWLHHHHPNTLALNVGAVADFGYLKDLPEILYRLHEGFDVRSVNKNEWGVRKKGIRGSKRWKARKLRREREREQILEMIAKEKEEKKKEKEKAKKEKAAAAALERAMKEEEEEKPARRGRTDKDINRVILFKEKCKDWEFRKRGKKGSKKWKVRRQRRQKDMMKREIESIVEDDNFEDQVVFEIESDDDDDDEEEEEEEEEEEDFEEVVVKLESATEEDYVDQKEKARRLRKEKDKNRANRALERYNDDPRYRFLYDCVCDVFAETLKRDLQHMRSGNCNRISLAAKWCPSLDSSYDKVTLLCQGIARRVFPVDSDAEFERLEEANYLYKVRDKLRKEVLVPLRRTLELPEVFMSAKKWDSLPYNRVPSVAMMNYKDLFGKHDNERFIEYLMDVRSGKAKIAAGALLPHEIISALDDEDGGTVAELQWSRMVEDVSKKGKLTNCIAVCDVSESMSGTPMEVCVALGLLVSELSEEPWKGKVITFSANPELHIIEGETLESKTQFIRNMDWGYNTNFQKVFDRILKVAVEGRLTEDQMIKKVFVFSDMEFDNASGIYQREYGSSSSSETDEETDDEEVEKINYKEKEEFDPKEEWKTDYEVIQRKFKEKGYNKVPEIVFWNLRNSSSTPVIAKQLGVALVSGFSKNLLKLFLKEGGIVNPEHVLWLAVGGEEYKKLAVYD